MTSDSPASGRHVPQEGKLAETAPNRPLALTIGAAAVTLVVVIGILTGPSVIDCFGGPDNAGMCLRDKLAGAGLAPSVATAPESEAGEPAAEALATAPEAETAPSEGAVPEDLIAATFGLLRAEPDGSVVIAGSGTPGSEVEVYADEELIGRTTVEESGDWVLVPEEPIAPGGREITLAEAGKDGRAGQSFVVVIDPDRDSQPLVVASEPGEASEVLQGLERPEPVEVASVPDEVAAAPQAPEPPVQAPAAPAEPVADEGDAPASEASPVPADAEVADEASDAPEEAVAEPEPVETAVAEPEVTTDLSEPDEPAAPAETESTAEPEAPEAGAETEDALAAVAAPTVESPVPAAPEAAETAVPPTIDAIEIDGDRTFFAGAGPDGATMRLYVDDVFIADALVEGGRWLVEAGDILPGPQHAVRIDMLAANSAEVAARAEVNFRVDVPAQTTAVAQAPAAGQQPAATDATEPTAQPSQPQPQATAEPVPGPAEAAAVPEPESAEPETAIDVAEAADADAVPTMVAEPVGDPELQRFASGRAIIRRGDNLWTIARRVYGQGIRYTTIYQANATQIRDPDWIYPGQVFDLPKAEQ